MYGKCRQTRDLEGVSSNGRRGRRGRERPGLWCNTHEGWVHAYSRRAGSDIRERGRVMVRRVDDERGRRPRLRPHALMSACVPGRSGCDGSRQVAGGYIGAVYFPLRNPTWRIAFHYECFVVGLCVGSREIGSVHIGRGGWSMPKPPPSRSDSCHASWRNPARLVVRTRIQSEVRPHTQLLVGTVSRSKLRHRKECIQISASASSVHFVSVGDTMTREKITFAVSWLHLRR